MKRTTYAVLAAGLFAVTGVTLSGSSHREALSVLNEP
jgi:hypothetical protein